MVICHLWATDIPTGVWRFQGLLANAAGGGLPREDSSLLNGVLDRMISPHTTLPRQGTYRGSSHVEELTNISLIYLFILSPAHQICS